MKTNPSLNRSLTTLLCAATAAAALSFAHPASANLITNGGFETGDFTGWTATAVTTDVTGTVNSVAPHSGNFQAISSFGSITQNVTTTPGGSYVVDFWLAGDSGINGDVSVLWGGVSIFSHVFTSPFGYTEYTFNVTASSATTALEFDVPTALFQGDFHFDDVSVNVGVPDGGSTLGLLSLSVVALLGATRLRFLQLAA